ncbi:MAG: VWA domain-containing protein [Myxococcota bacterium]
MLISFVQTLRSVGVPVGTQELLGLCKALKEDLHDSSLDGFYHVARCLFVHREAHLDLFDRAFVHHFKGVELSLSRVHEELLEWLRDAVERQRELTEEERAFFGNLSPEEIEKLFEQRLEEQKKRHDGGNRWIGTGGTSPFGHSGAPGVSGIRVGGAGQNRSAFEVASERRFASYRDDLTLDVRQMQFALRKLRSFVRFGEEEELDLESTIRKTSDGGGEIDIVTRPPRRPNTRIVLMMDVGGSMDPHTELVSRLFSAARKSSHFRELQTYFFHNCVYSHVYPSAQFDKGIRVRDLVRRCSREYHLIVVGDALMAPYELLSTTRAEEPDDDGLKGIGWLLLLARHFPKAIWLNPEAPRFWEGNTIEYVKQVFPMFPLTLRGLEEGITHLSRVTV